MPMSTQFRTALTQLYLEMRPRGSFLKSFFVVRPGNISRTEVVQKDIKRLTEDIAAVVHRGEGPNYNNASEFTLKEWTPPTVDEAMAFGGQELMRRMEGIDPYGAAAESYLSQLAKMVLDGAMVLDAKIERYVELQASQILQTGELALKDKNGVVVANVDFFPKTTHFPTVGTSWSAAGTPLTDIGLLTSEIRTDSGYDANLLLFGENAINDFLGNATVKDHLDNRRMNLGEINPQLRERGATFQGTVTIGSYIYEMWSYPGQGVEPGASSPTSFIDKDKCIVMSSGAPLDLMFAGIPPPIGTSDLIQQFLPGRMALTGAVDILPNVWASVDGGELNISLKSRPFPIPTAIDSYGCITTVSA